MTNLLLALAMWPVPPEHFTLPSIEQCSQYNLRASRIVIAYDSMLGVLPGRVDWRMARDEYENLRMFWFYALAIKANPLDGERFDYRADMLKLAEDRPWLQRLLGRDVR